MARPGSYRFSSPCRSMMPYALTAGLFTFVIALPTSALALEHDGGFGKARFNFGLMDQFEEICSEDEGCAEISAYDQHASRLYTTNATDNLLRVLPLDQWGRFGEGETIDLSSYGAAPNSVAVSRGRVAVAMEAAVATDPGRVVLFNRDGVEQRQIPVGALPDMLTFTPDGRYLLVANEGEPNDDYTVDPEGSVSVIDTRTWQTRDADFRRFDSHPPRNVRVFGPGASVAQDLEPEYIAVSADSRTAWISLQENNALAVLDIRAARIEGLIGLGLKRHQRRRNALDASNEDGGEDCRRPLDDPEQCINIQRWPVFGMYQPDAIASFRHGRKDFVITANEGDARDYDGFSEEARVADETIILDPQRYPDVESLKDDAALGRLKTTTASGDRDGDGDVDRIHAYGARSFSIWSAQGKRVYDSGGEFEAVLASLEAQGRDVWVDSRSDDKGPEPESVVVGTLGHQRIAFIGLERASGIMVYDISRIRRPTFLAYIDLKLFDDVGPEGLIFVPRTRTSGWLIVSSEVSNTISTIEVSVTRGLF